MLNISYQLMKYLARIRSDFARPTRRGETPVRALPGAAPRPAASVRETHARGRTCRARAHTQAQARVRARHAADNVWSHPACSAERTQGRIGPLSPCQSEQTSQSGMSRSPRRFRQIGPLWKAEIKRGVRSAPSGRRNLDTGEEDAAAEAVGAGGGEETFDGRAERLGKTVQAPELRRARIHDLQREGVRDGFDGLSAIDAGHETRLRPGLRGTLRRNAAQDDTRSCRARIGRPRP